MVDENNGLNSEETTALKSLEEDLKTMGSALKETADSIVEGKYSSFPVLIAHVSDIVIGDKILDREEHQTAYHFSASTLEDLVEKGVILSDKKSMFEQQFSADKNTYCILLIHPEVMRFIFTPL